MQLGRAAGFSARILLAHRLRTALSAFSVALGVAALVASVGSSEAARQDLTARIAALGSNVLTVDAGKFERMGRRMFQVRSARTLTPADGTALVRTFSAVRRAAGVAEGSAQLAWRGESRSVSVMAVEPELFAIRNVRAVRGRLLTAAEKRGLARVVVLGGVLAEDAFGSYNPVGETVRLRGAPYRVVGVTAKKGLGLGGESLDAAAFVPLRTGLARIFGRSWLDRIVLELADSGALRRLRPAITETLRRRHRIRPARENDFSVLNPAKILAMGYQTGEMFRSLTAAVAGVSLVTSGVGILAVMLMAVRERVREIGLRRALGARRRDILAQFLGEAALLSGLGGFAGAAAGLMVTRIACAALGWPLLLPWRAAGEGLAFSVALGIAAGVLPAVRAARLAPDTALRTAV